MQADTLSREAKIEYIGLLEEQRRRVDSRKSLNVYDTLYPWQKDFIAATANHHECCLCAANQIGKTYLGTDIDAIHLLGDYPDCWEGHKFDFAPLIWCLGYSMEKARDLLQTALFGEYNGAFAGGLIPKDRIVGWESAGGTANAMRSVTVSHATGQVSKVQFWSYTQGQHAIMGDVVDWFHIDEEPKDQTIRPQVLTRTINGNKGRGGRGIYTFTPENGRTDLVIKFMDNPSSAQFFMMKGWKDALHMTKEKCERLIAQYPAHQVKMRSEGYPMLGHGRIYDLSEEFITCEPFKIPAHWDVINGMDFGWDHPQAHIKIVRDPDNEMYYAINAYKASKVSANDAWGATKIWAEDVPVAWPHDGLQNEKGRDDAVQQKVHYENAGFKMLPRHATWQEGGNSVESGIYLIGDLMRKGKFKIFSGLIELLEEIRQYHRDEKGKIVKKKDDLLDALRYAMMMIRFACKVGDVGRICDENVYIPTAAGYR